LDDVLTKKGSDGELLVTMTSNFDEVSSAMSREDLESTEKAPWTQYLLAKDTAIDVALEGPGPSTGRYRDRDDDPEDVALQDAMSRMRLLDNRLKEVHKRDLQLKHDLNSRTLRLDDVDDLSSEAPTSGRLSSRSVSSVASTRMNDNTFLTRARSEKTSQANDSPQYSARSAATIASEVISPSDADIEEIESIPVVKEKKKKIAPEKRKGGLNEEDEIHLRYLMSVSEDSSEWQDMSTYGLNSEQSTRIAFIDDELEQYGHFARLHSSVDDIDKDKDNNRRDDLLLDTGVPETEIHDTDTDRAKRDGYDDFLAEQRQAKEKAKVGKALDSKLHQLRSGTPDLSGLVDVSKPVNLSLDEDEIEDAQRKGAMLVQVPPVDFVPAQRKVTSSDLNNIIAYLRQQQKEHCPEDLQNEEEKTEIDNSDVGVVGGGEGNNRQAIDRLLSSLRPQVRRLTDLRSSLQDVMECIPKNDSNVNSTIESMSLKDHHDDAMEDIQWRYGLENKDPMIQENNINNSNSSPQRNPQEIKSKLERLKLSLAVKRGAVGVDMRGNSTNNGSEADDMTSSSATEDWDLNQEQLGIQEQVLPLPPHVGATYGETGWEDEEQNIPQKIII
jgi:hypothetical protein